jgi:hypothetical protein
VLGGGSQRLPAKLFLDAGCGGWTDVCPVSSAAFDETRLLKLAIGAGDGAARQAEIGSELANWR